MADWLILQLPRGADDPASWLIADGRGEPRQAERSGSLQAAAAEAAGRRLAVLVPSTDVVITSVELPVKSGVKPQQLVPYALEEQLAADVETLHFAIGDRAADGRTAVAVVSRELLRGWLATLAQWGLTPEVLCSPAALVPDNPGQLVALLDGDTLYVRESGRPALALSGADLTGALEAALGPTIGEQPVLFHATQAQWERVAPQIEALRPRLGSLRVQLLTLGTLPLLAPQLTDGHSLNLLTGEFAPPRSSGGHWQRWRLAATLAASLFALHVLGLSLQLHHANAAERELDEQIAAVAQRVLPGDSGDGNVRARVQRLLDQSSAQSTLGLLPPLNALAQAMQDVRGAAVQSLAFTPTAPIEVKVHVPSAESEEHIVESLKSNGWQANLVSANPAGDGFDGRFQFQAGGGTR